MSKDKKIGRYIIREILGEGAMGSVYKAYDPNLERLVAVKTMRTANIQKEDELHEFKERFFQELRVCARLGHPNIVAVFDSDLHDSEPFLVMEFIDGYPLDVFIRKHFEKSLHHYLTILEQVAAGLDYAHDKDIIHRDIKPGNILVYAQKANEFSAKIVDFGLAKLKDSKLTMTGFFLGTPSYASPEQIINGRVDSRSDIYSFGTVAYEMLTGELPFDAESLHSILYQIANSPPKLAFESFAQHLDVHAVHEVFAHVFQKDPKDRYQTAGQFVADLMPLVKPLKTIKRPTPCPVIRGKKTNAAEEASAKTTSQSMADKAASDSDPKTKIIEQARSQFRQAYRTRNLSSVGYCLQELKKLGADTTHESGLYKKLEKEIQQEKEKQTERDRNLLAEKIRTEFRIALKAKNLQSVRYCLEELRKLKVDTEKEEKELADLEKSLREEAERKQQEKIRLQLVEEARSAFQDLFIKKDVEGCKRRIDELEELKADRSAELKKVKLLEKQKKLEDEQRQSWIAKTREEFKKALARKQLARCGFLINELESLLKADASEEKAAYARLDREKKKQDALELQEREIRNIRTAFSDALGTRDLKNCRDTLEDLKKLNADVSQEQKLLTDLKKKIRDEEADKIKQGMIEHNREKFQEALKQKDLKSCRHFIKELRTLKADIKAERKALRSIEQIAGEHEAERLKEHMARHLRNEFQKALDKRNVENCRYYLRELEQLGVDISEERDAVGQLKSRGEVEDELKEKMTVQSREEFQKGLQRKDPSFCEHYLNVLKGLGADTASEQKDLAALENEMLRSKKIGETARAEENLKQKMIEHYRFEFLAAFKTDQIDNCRYYLQELEQLEADVESETQAVYLLELKLQQNA